MEDRYIEIEPYEEIVDRDEVFSTPSGRSAIVQSPLIGVSHLRSRYPKDPVLLYIMLM